MTCHEMALGRPEIGIKQTGKGDCKYPRLASGLLFRGNRFEIVWIVSHENGRALFSATGVLGKQAAKTARSGDDMIGKCHDFFLQLKMKPPVKPRGVSMIWIFVPFVPEVRNPREAGLFFQTIGDHMARHGRRSGINCLNRMSPDNFQAGRNSRRQPADLIVGLHQKTSYPTFHRGNAQRIQDTIYPCGPQHRRPEYFDLVRQFVDQGIVPAVIPIVFFHGQHDRSPPVRRQILGKLDGAQRTRPAQRRKKISHHQEIFKLHSPTRA